MIDLGSKINAITFTYLAQIGLAIRSTNIGVQKIKGSSLKSYEMIFAMFSVQNKVGWDRFFENIFLLADISIEVVLDIPILSFSNADINFDTKNLAWRSYTTEKALPTTSRIKLINKKEYAKAALDKNSEIFVVHIAALVATRTDCIKVHLSQTSHSASYITMR